MMNAENFMSELNKLAMSTVEEISKEEILKSVLPMIEDEVRKRYGFIPEIHEVVTPKATKKIIATTHEIYDEVLQYVNLDIPVYLEGPAGTGKNVLCNQIAESLDLDFYFTNAVTQEYKLTGFIDANGSFHETQFYKAFVNGGLFFLDEMDASVPEVLVILNAAIANRYFDFPTGRVNAHKDFRVIAAGNTAGKGADNNYTGRYCLDGASLDRFAVVEMGYSSKIEKSVSNGNDDLLKFAHNFRQVVADAGIECICSYRAIDRIAKLESIGKIALDKIIKSSLIKGLDEDDVNIIYNKLCKIKEDKYTEAIGTILGKEKRESDSDTKTVSYESDGTFSFSF